MSDKSDSLIAEINERIQQITDNLPPCVDAAAVSTSAKTPFKFICFREALLWRTEDLARNALERFRAGELLSGLVLTRCVSESAAAMWYIMEKIKAAIHQQATADLDNTAMRMLLGNKVESDLPDPVNVLTMVQHAEKAMPGVEKQYLLLCEYAHPNWTGTTLLFSETNAENHRTNFGRYRRGGKSAELIGLSSLNAALVMFQHAYNQVSNSMSRFIDICEAELKGKGSPD